MEQVKIRALRPDEVEVRAANLTAKGAQFLIYKDARVDKRILDETFGIFGWRNRYEVINDNLYCTVDIWDAEKKEWISKCDCGTESNTEKEKGEASDAFKRACFNVGIGRELYTKIFIFIAGITKPDPKRDGKFILANPYEKYSVSEMRVDEVREKITRLAIQDSRGKVVFLWEESQNAPQTPAPAPAKPARTEKADVPPPPELPAKPEETPDMLPPPEETITREQGEMLLREFEEKFGKCTKNSDSAKALKNFLEDYGVKKLWDLPCGYYEDAMAKIRADAPIREAS